MYPQNKNYLTIPFIPIKQSGFYDGIYDENVIVLDIEEEDTVLENEDVEQEVDDEVVYDDDCENESVVDDDLIVTQVMQELGRQEPFPVAPLPHSSPMAQA